jgi:glutamine synthetase
MNYGYSEASIAADQIQLYKLLCRQVAHHFDLTASFLPKPVVGINGSGMHTNMSVSKGKQNLFWDNGGAENLSGMAYSFINRILTVGNDICLILNSSVNSYRRLDPHFEAPNQIKSSPTDRGSMVRIPIGNEKSSRVEVRSIAPDANPYMALYTLFKTGLEGAEGHVPDDAILPDNIYDAIANFRDSSYVKGLLGEELQDKYASLKEVAADRSPRRLGSLVKPGEIQFHHEVQNQLLWNQF